MWWRRWPWIVAAAGAGLLGYGGGRIQGAIAAGEVADEASSQLAIERKSHEALSSELVETKQRLELLRARRYLDRAARAVAEHNYGLAQERVKAASDLMKDREGYREIATELSGMNLLEPGEGERLASELRSAIARFDVLWAKQTGDDAG